MASRLTGARKDDGGSFWVPADGTAVINGAPLGGLIYVGEGLRGADWDTPEPSLIDPRLKVDMSGGARRARSSDKWLSYAGLSPKARGKALGWLATGGKDPQADIGCVSLYFYGLERRALHDAKTCVVARGEIPAIGHEVQRLLDTYGRDVRFRAHARHFLATLAAIDDRRSIGLVPAPLGHRGLSLELRLGLARLAAARIPLPVDWALAWLNGHPETQTTFRGRGRTVQERLEKNFGERYQAAYSSGLLIPICNRTLTVIYRPANQGVKPLVRRFKADVSMIRAPIRALQRLAVEGLSLSAGGHKERSRASEKAAPKYDVRPLPTPQVTSDALQVAPHLQLKALLHAIRQRGYVPVRGTGSGRFGLTLEYLLDIVPNSSKAADFRGIEIKSKHGSELQTLFSKVPSKYLSCGNRRGLILGHGYLDSKRGRKALYTSFSNKADPLGFVLKVRSDHVVVSRGDEDILHYDREVLEKTLIEKHNETVYVSVASRLGVSGQMECCYESIQYCRKPMVDRFFQIIDEGRVHLDFTLSERPDGSIKDHGFLWRIRSDALTDLYEVREDW